MPQNTDHIQTTHVGSLPRTPDLLEANGRFQEGEATAQELDAALDTGQVEGASFDQGLSDGGGFGGSDVGGFDGGGFDAGGFDF